MHHWPAPAHRSWSWLRGGMGRGAGLRACERLPKPGDRSLAVIAHDRGDLAAVPNCVAQLGKLSEPHRHRLLGHENVGKRRPERLGRDRVLEFAEIEVLKLRGQ